MIDFQNNDILYNIITFIIKDLKIYLNYNIDLAFNVNVCCLDFAIQLYTVKCFNLIIVPKF